MRPLSTPARFEPAGVLQRKQTASGYYWGRTLLSQDSQPLDLVIIAALAFTLLLPSTNTFFAVRAIVALFAFVATLRRPVDSPGLSFVITFTLLVFINLLIGAMTVTLIEGALVWSDVRHELLRFSYYSLLALSVMKLRSRFTVLLFLCKTLLLFHLTIQVTQLINADFINPVIDAFFPSGGTHLELSTYDWPAFRSGSIYLNPNTYVMYPVLFLGVFLQARRLSQRRGTLLWITLCMASVVLTGSRMGLILSVLVLLGSWARLENFPNVRPLHLMGVVGGILGAALAVTLIDLQGGVRVFDVSGGMTSSIQFKFEILLDAFENTNPLYVLFGSLGSPTPAPQDMEMAHILVSFGLMGAFWYLFLLRFLVKRNSETYAFIAAAAVMIMVFAGLAASIVLNLAVFPLFLIVLLVKWSQPETDQVDVQDGVHDGVQDRPEANHVYLRARATQGGRP
ncbi:MAG TPA: hypothetical protein VFC82_02785 [Actinomycetaceae bacterium]|nr:hypothetical protein [Actinomycetaceae bacterium]